MNGTVTGLPPLHYAIPTGAISTYDDGRVYVTVTAYRALHGGWDPTPERTSAR